MVYSKDWEFYIYDYILYEHILIYCDATFFYLNYRSLNGDSFYQCLRLIQLSYRLKRI
jgi:hypothetical protein